MNDASPIQTTTVTPITPVTPAVAPSAKIGVLLVNLGTPDTPDAAGVRRYLRVFLTDPRVIENQGPLWDIVLNGIILPVRPWRKARDGKRSGWGETGFCDRFQVILPFLVIGYQSIVGVCPTLAWIMRWDVPIPSKALKMAEPVFSLQKTSQNRGPRR